MNKRNQRIEKDEKGEIRFLVRLTLSLLFVYICLFEFILPVNSVLPAPSQLLDSVLSIWKEHDLIFSAWVSFSIVTLSVLLSYLFLFVTKTILFEIKTSLNGLLLGFRLFRYIPLIFAVIIFEFWFRGSYLAELTFSFLSAYCFLSYAYITKMDTVKTDFLIFAQSLKLDKKTVSGKIIWNDLKPLMHTELMNVNIMLWFIVILFEYISNAEGLGMVVFRMMNYKDFPGIFVILIVCMVFILIINQTTKFISHKVIHWKCDKEGM